MNEGGHAQADEGQGRVPEKSSCTSSSHLRSFSPDSVWRLHFLVRYLDEPCLSDLRLLTGNPAHGHRQSHECSVPGELEMSGPADPGW